MNEYLFTFDWTDGKKSLNDYIIDWLKENHISFRYDGYFILEADVFRTGQYSAFESTHISGTLYGVNVRTHIDKLRQKSYNS